MIKTTQAQFEEFKAEFMKYVELFGLKDYQIYFEHKKLEDSFADISVNCNACIATVVMAQEIPGECKFDFCPKESAKHEAIHLLLSRLYDIADCRYVQPEELKIEDERVVRILQKVL